MARTVKKPAARRREIIKAAREHFQTEEYRKITMQQLMDKVGIAKGTIYHHFGSKAELLEAVIEEMVAEEVARKQELLAINQNLDALKKLKLLLTENRLADDNEKILENLHHPENYEIHTRQLAYIIVKVAPLYASVISQGCSEGIFTTKHPLECAELLLGGIQFLTDVGVFPWNQDQIQRRTKAMPHLLETQLGAPKGSFNFLTYN